MINMHETLVQTIIVICSIMITSVLVPLINEKKKQVKANLSEDQQRTIEYWTEVAVRWAKQELWESTGAIKKANVLNFLDSKFLELGIDIDIADVSRIVEAVYEQVKKEGQFLELDETE